MKIFLAATFNLKDDPDLIAQSKYLLESYYYIRPWQVPILQSVDEYIIDSGAFSYMHGARGTKHTSVAEIEQYCRDYGNFVKENNVKNFIEFDVQNVFGMEEYRRLDDILCDIVGRTPMRVMHKMNGIDWWQKVTKENDFVAYGGISAYRQNMQDIDYAVIPQFIKIAHENGARVHGLGFTQMSRLKQIKFDTVDSTSWNVSAAYGSIAYFTGTEVRSYRPKGKGVRSKDSFKLRQHNFKEWLKFQKYAETHL